MVSEGVAKAMVLLRDFCGKISFHSKSECLERVKEGVVSSMALPHLANTPLSQTRMESRHIPNTQISLSPPTSNSNPTEALFPARRTSLVDIRFFISSLLSLLHPTTNQDRPYSSNVCPQSYFKRITNSTLPLTLNTSSLSINLSSLFLNQNHQLDYHSYLAFTLTLNVHFSLSPTLTPTSHTNPSQSFIHP
jgi:hypothetical protein